MRLFHVYVLQKPKPLRYANLDGNRALDLMLAMKERGFETVAETTAHGITEQLSLQSMHNIFADFNAKMGERLMVV